MFEEDLPNGDEQSKQLPLTSRPAEAKRLFSTCVLFSIAVMNVVPVGVVAIPVWLQNNCTSLQMIMS